MVSFVHYLVICPLAALAGFIDSIAGGGGFISLPSFLIIGLPVHNAIGTNKISCFFGTALATGAYAKKGYIKWALAPIGIIGAFAGSFLGAEIALRISDGFFKILMLFIIPLSAIYILRKKNFDKEYEPYPLWKSDILVGCISFFLGIYDGFYGPGTGTFLILALNGLAHLNIFESNGLTKIINLSTNVAAIVVYLTNGKSIIPLGLAAGAFNLLGSFAGTKVFSKKGSKSTRPVIILVLTIFFVKLLYEIIIKKA